jgi:DNA-binding response OmpR family regulator
LEPTKILPDSKTIPKIVLLVDDNTDIQTVMSISLEQQGYSVQVAGDGESALEMLDSIQPDFAIIDKGLPDLDGLQLGKKIRQHSSGALTRLVLFSGHHEPDLVEQATQIGFVAFLTKPISLKILLEKLRSLH